MNKPQFRVLYREFLFRLVDIELLSSSALGDSNRLLGQFAALLIFVSILLAVPSLGVANSRTPPALRLFLAWSAEHFLIATSMLAVGLFAVLSWDSTFPDRRDILVLAPLPVRARTLFLAKMAAAGTALALTIALLHSLAGVGWPLALGAMGTVQIRTPALGYLSAEPPANASSIEPLLKRDLAPALSKEMGVAVGIITNGEQRVCTFGTAKPDSLYQIASISKTFTSLALAKMVVDGEVRLDQPLRELLPAGRVRKPEGREITLLDLATHRSGLPTMPDNAGAYLTPNPEAAYPVQQLYAFLARLGVARAAHPPFVYSNAGVALLGQALADRAGVTYPELIANKITRPLGMKDTAVELSSEQRDRIIQAYSVLGEHRAPWEIGALAPAGGIWSTAGDMLIFLQTQLRGDSRAIQLSHELRTEVAPGMRIALAWIQNDSTGTYWHNGAISAYTSYAFFNLRERYAAIVLVNQGISLVTFSGLLARHIEQRLRGERTVSLAHVTVPGSQGWIAVIRAFVVYWFTMAAAGLFVFCCVLVLQGLASQLLPRPVFLRISSWLQLASFCGIICVYFLQPMFATGQAQMQAQGDGPLSWSPSYWFLGLFQQLNGSPAMAPLAKRAWIGLAAALFSTATVYALSYFRTLKKIAEEPDIVARAAGGIWLPKFGNRVQTAIVQFSIKTLLRSRLHRLIVAFYLGIGFAFVILLMKTPAVAEQLEDAPVTDALGQVNTPLLAASIAMMGFAIIGIRVIFSMPLDLRANWIFQVTGVRGAAECLVSSRRSLLTLSLLPVWLSSACAFFWLWPWQAATGHLAILAGLGVILTEICLHRFQKIPFTCSYLPGKSQIHLSVLGALGLLWAISLSVRYERQVLESTAGTVAVVITLVVIAMAARWRTQAEANVEEEVQFEDEMEPALRTLGLNRDGTWEVGAGVSSVETSDGS